MHRLIPISLLLWFSAGNAAGPSDTSFTALNAAGQPTTPTSGATPHPCVRVKTTGLVWEVKTADGGLRDQNWTYSWYDSVHNYGGNPGTASGGSCKTPGRCDTEKYIADVNAATLCGYTNWRMPTLKELEGLVHMGHSDPAIDRSYFPNTPSSTFWSSSPHATISNVVWVVNFYHGYPGFISRSASSSVRLVRGGSTH